MINDYPPELASAICNHVWFYMRNGTYCPFCSLWRPRRDAIDTEIEEEDEQ